ncbi:hypothetical protein [Thiocapsa rosea]|nr:hypothetical protein [Thiocapsa rosea]
MSSSLEDEHLALDVVGWVERSETHPPHADVVGYRSRLGCWFSLRRFVKEMLLLGGWVSLRRFVKETL